MSQLKLAGPSPWDRSFLARQEAQVSEITALLNVAVVLDRGIVMTIYKISARGAATD